MNKKNRHSSILLRFLQCIGILLVCFVIYCFYISAGKPSIQIDYKQEYLKANKPSDKESDNAGVLYNEIAEIYVEPPKIIGEQEIDTNSCYVPPPPEFDLLPEISNIHRSKQLNDKEFAALSKWIYDNNKATNLFLEASARPLRQFFKRSNCNMGFSQAFSGAKINSRTVSRHWNRKTFI
ncbi:MAG: hypothetical protein JW806_10665 [Sedimentisphaerales bacterium]|nr:hypothetical protein [Sedimentisphaerales bacterium]